MPVIKRLKTNGPKEPARRADTKSHVVPNKILIFLLTGARTDYFFTRGDLNLTGSITRHLTCFPCSFRL